MKWKIFGLAVVLVGLLITVPVGAVKPTTNLASAQKVAWHLSADVAQIPPYGCVDIPGSDTASKLIVNQPNGNTEVTLTGVMNGLNPNTIYTVYVSNGYSKDAKRWNIVEDWKLRFLYGGNYDHDMTVSVQYAPVCGVGNTFTGTGSYPANAIIPDITWVVNGIVNGQPNPLDFNIAYDGSTYMVHAIGVVNSDGSLSGSWESNAGQAGDWNSYQGSATSIPVTPGWTGFGTTLEGFTFITDEFGAGSWHVNLRAANFVDIEGKPRTGTFPLSVWINEAGGTMLISDNFDVVIG